VTLRTLLVVAVATLGVACRGDAPAAPLREVALPDLSRLDASVQAQVRGQYAALERVRTSEGASVSQRATAYGEFGMLLHAAEFYADAEPAYRNAQALMPSEPRWPYYLAHVRRSTGDSAQAIALLTRVLELRPNDVPALVWLGRAYLDQGQPDQAEPLFTRALATAPMTLAAKVGLAQIAIGRRDFARAVTLLEEGFQILPTADSLHSLMATAYRGLGNTAKADEHLKRWRNTDVLVQDPLREELDLALESGLSYELRGVRVMTDGDYQAAADFFRRGVALAPGTTQLGRSLRHKLGTALYLQGRVPEAMAQFEEVVRLAPTQGQDEPTAKAYYSMGVLQASAGQATEAIAALTRAVQYSPSYLVAQVALGNALRAAGRVEASLEPYRAAVEGDPRAAEARFGYAMALVRLKRWREARASLEESRRVLPDRNDLTHALARLLASAPDATVREGQRALMLTEAVMQTTRTPDVGETLAMAQAELGRFDQAAEIQRSVIDAARGAGDQAAVRRLTANLRLYERRQPCRTPWADDDPVHTATPK
jgi:tetratricopeptide (TPR) repeat protein